MPSRTARIASVVFVNILAGLPIMTMARGETAAPDTCLSAPKGEAPAGSHWRYHIDHVNKRNCWYLRLEDGSVSQAVPQNSTTAPLPPAKPSVADARAEFRPQDKTVANPPASAGSAAPAGSGASEASPANTSIWNAAPPMATRWPDVPAATTVQNTAPATPAPANDVPQTLAASAQPAAAPAAPANLSAPIAPETIRTLIAGVLGALAFAGAGALIARRRGLGRRLRRRVAQSSRGPIWETTDDDRIILSDHPYPDHRDYRPRFARGVATAAASGGRKPESARRAPRYAQR
jgi:hypothetical protein